MFFDAMRSFGKVNCQFHENIIKVWSCHFLIFAPKIGFEPEEICTQCHLFFVLVVNFNFIK